MNHVYILSAINYNLKSTQKSNLTESEIVYGYFSNLKRIHLVLKGKNVQAYSTIARKLKLRRTIVLENVTITTEYSSIKVNHLVIRIVEINKFYKFTKQINLASLISGDVFKNDLGLILAE